MNKYRKLLQSATEEELISIFDKHEHIQQLAEEEVLDSEFGIKHDDLEFIHEKALDFFLENPTRIIQPIDLLGLIDDYRQYRESKINE